jgi:hypothetical protein
MKKILISLCLLAFSVSLFGQVSTYPKIQKKQNFMDNTNFVVRPSVGTTGQSNLILASDTASLLRNYLNVVDSTTGNRAYTSDHRADLIEARVTDLENAGANPIYYVSNSGSDIANGLTTSTPFRTIQRINDTILSPGSRVLFKKGDTWRETLVVPSSGTFASYITFSSYGSGDKPKILGSEVITAWTQKSGNVYGSNTAVDDPYAMTWDANIYFKETDGDISWGRVKKSTSWRNCVTEYDWFWSGDSIYVYSPTNPNTRYLGVEVTQRDNGIALNSKEYLTFDGLEISYSSLGGIDEAISPLVNLTGLNVLNCNIHHIGIKMSDTGYGLSLAHSNMLIQNNIIHDSGRRNISLNTYGAAIQVSNIIVENNTLYRGFHTTGVDIASTGTGTINNVVIRNNLISDDVTEILDGVESIISNGMYIAEESTGDITNIFVYNNVVMNTTHLCMSLNLTSCFIYNNTFYGVNPNMTELYAGMVHMGGGTAVIENNIFYNNLATATNANYRCLNLEAGGTSNYNLFYSTDANQKLVYWGQSYTVAQWAAYKAASSQDANSPTPADPVFTSTTDFSLQLGSPAINTGVVITGMPQSDYLNHPIVGARDIGAYEKQ